MTMVEAADPSSRTPLVENDVMTEQTERQAKQRLSRHAANRVGPDHGKSYHRPPVSAVRQALLAWFDMHGRSLPWRIRFDPAKADDSEWLAQRAYRVWVSETMAQQTQIATLIPYFEKWMTKWPTVTDLAKADDDDVQRAWAGLGYYSRARRLLEGARLVSDSYGGLLPRSTSELVEKIPGVGPYTAGAIASIAFNVRAPLVDGNVVRVVSRLCAIGADPKSKSAIDLYWSIADDLVDPNRPGDFNESLMDLGATVCTPKQPSCKECPVNHVCLAYAEQVGFERLRVNQMRGVFSVGVLGENDGGDENDANLAVKDEVEDGMGDECKMCPPLPPLGDIEELPVTRYPAKINRKKPRLQECAVTIVEHVGRNDAVKQEPDGSGPPRMLLVVRGPNKGLLAGMWDFPMVVLSDIDPNAESDHETDAEGASDEEFTPSQKSSQSKPRKRSSRSKSSQASSGCVVNMTPTTVQRRDAMDTLLRDLVGDGVRVVRRVDIGTVPHVFTHIKRTMHVEHIQIDAPVIPPHAVSTTGDDTVLITPITPTKVKRGRSNTPRNQEPDTTLSQANVGETRWVSINDLETKKLPIPKPLVKALDMLTAAGSKSKSGSVSQKGKDTKRVRSSSGRHESKGGDKKMRQQAITAFLSP